MVWPRKKFTEEDFVRLPPKGTAYRFAKRLGVSPLTVWRWYSYFKPALPVEHDRGRNAVYIKRDDFEKWCKATRRYKAAKDLRPRR